MLIMQTRALGVVCVLLLTFSAAAQTTPDLARVLARLDKLEKENLELQAEIRQLRTELHGAVTAEATSSPEVQLAEAAEAPVSERLAVLESKTADLAQTRVESTQRMPVAVTGMVLFNAYRNGRNGGTLQYPITAGLTPAPSTSGASFRQTVLGLKFQGPQLPGGGKASGNIYLDFFSGNTNPNNNIFRIRLATLDLAWKNTTVTVGQDKPINAPREPTSLAQVGFAPLTGSGNLWNWNPQARIEQRFSMGSETGIRAQAGVYETSEVYPGNNPPAFSASLERYRPAWQGRFEFFHGAETKRFEIAPGFSLSDSHVAGGTASSRVFSLDWLVRPVQLVEFSGAFFRGTNAAVLGALRQGFTVSPAGAVIPVHVTAGWGQIKIYATSKLSLHFYGGQEYDKARDLTTGSVTRNIQYAGNAVYKLAPNVLAAFEASQTRTTYLPFGLRLVNHYDLALGYLF